MNYSERKGYNELYTQYIIRQLSIGKIAKLDNVTSTTIRKALTYWKIPIRQQIKVNPTKPVTLRKVTNNSFIIRVGKNVLYKMYIEQDMSGTEIATCFNVNSTLVYEALKYWDIKKQTCHFYNVIGKDTLYDLYVTQQKSIYDIAEMWGTDPQKVLYAFRYWNLEIRDRSDSYKLRSLKMHGYDHTNLSKLTDKHWLMQQYKDFTLTEIAKSIGVSTWMVQNSFKKLSIDCYHKMSSYERLIVNFLHRCGVTTIVSNTRKIISPKELDIFLPDFNIAIEINGEYWHSTTHPHMYKDYHKEKTTRCNELGIILLQFWGNEIANIHKRMIVFSKIKQVLGITYTTIYADNITVNEIPHEVGVEFLSHNSLNILTANDPIFFGIMHVGDLVAVLCVDDNETNDSIIIHEYCIKIDINIDGGLKKIIDYITNMYHSMRDITGVISGQYYTHENEFIINGFFQTNWSTPLELAYDANKQTLTKSANHDFSCKRFFQIYDCGRVEYFKQLR